MLHPVLRPLSAGEILDRAFALYRARLLPFLATSLAVFAPLALVKLISILTATPLANARAATLALIALPAACSVVALGALTHLAARAYLGQPVSVGAALRRGVSRFPSLAATLVLLGIALALGWMGLMVGAAVVFVLGFAVVPAVVIENAAPFPAIRRSLFLANDDALRIFLILVVAYVITLLPSMAVEFTVRLGAGPFVGQSRLADVLSALVAALTYPFSTAVTVILYYDRRVRAEGLDMELAAGIASV